MHVVRWQFQVRFGHLKDVLGILRQWEVNVGQRAGWRATNVRVLQGLVGPSQSTVELETTIDNLGDLESSFNDMSKLPHHADAMVALEKYVVGGSDSWTVLKVIDLFEHD